MRGIENDWLIQDTQVTQRGLQAHERPAPLVLRSPFDLGQELIDSGEKVRGKGFDGWMSIHEHAECCDPLESPSFFLIGCVASFDQGSTNLVHFCRHHTFPKDQFCYGSIHGGGANVEHIAEQVSQQQHPEASSRSMLDSRCILDHLNPDVFRPGPESLLFLDHPGKKISTSSGHCRVHRRSQANDVQEGYFKPLQAMKHISGPTASHEGGWRSGILLHEFLLFFCEI